MRKGQSYYDYAMSELSARLECGSISRGDYERACRELEDWDLVRKSRRKKARNAQIEKGGAS